MVTTIPGAKVFSSKPSILVPEGKVTVGSLPSSSIGTSLDVIISSSYGLTKKPSLELEQQPYKMTNIIKDITKKYILYFMTLSTLARV